MRRSRAQGGAWCHRNNRDWGLGNREWGLLLADCAGCQQDQIADKASIPYSPLPIPHRAKNPQKCVKMTQFAPFYPQFPSNRAGRPLEIRGCPLKMIGRPLKMIGRPLKITGRPLKMRGCPLEMIGCPLKMRGRPLEMTGCPITKTA
jgi:hypothetical protein